MGPGVEPIQSQKEQGVIFEGREVFSEVVRELIPVPNSLPVSEEINVIFLFL